MKVISTNPAKNYEVLGEVESATQQQVTDTVAASHKAQVTWEQLSLDERLAAIKSFVQVAKNRSEDLAQIITLETGRPITGSRADVSKGLECFDSYIATAKEHLAPKVTYETDTELHRVYREPWGVVAAICPWNFPTTNIAWQCGQALIAGNTIVYKNSEENPLFAKLLQEIISESDLPANVFSVISGDGQIGEWLARSDINRISFTGSFPVGQKLTQIAAEKFIPITTELGGSNPYIIFEGVAITDDIIENVYTRRFNHSGQFCTSVKRLIIHESLLPDVVDRLAKLTQAKKIGDPLSESTDLGPVVAKRQLEKLEAQVQDAIAKGAQVVTGGKRPAKLEGAFYEPTILVGITKDMRVWKEETFGPVLPVIAFTTETEAIELANDTEYGLSAYMSTKDSEQFGRVARQLQAGMIAENQVVNLLAAYNPFGGYKHSGMGRENGAYGFEEVTQVKVISELK